MAAPKALDLNLAIPRTGWFVALRDTTIEVFSTMVGIAASVPEDAVRVEAHVTGVVGIAGAMRAIFSLRCSSKSSIKVASQMLGISPDDPNAEKDSTDAVGEICNIVAGYFKAKIGLGEQCSLSVPTIVTGSDYAIHSGTGHERIEFPLLFDGEPIWIALDIRQ